MNKRYNPILIANVALVVAFGFAVPARASEIDDLKAEMRIMQQSMDQMQKKMSQLEQDNQKQKQKQQVAATKTAPAPPAEGPRPAPPLIDANGNEVVTIAPQSVTLEGHSSEVTQRP